MSTIYPNFKKDAFKPHLLSERERDILTLSGKEIKKMYMTHLIGFRDTFLAGTFFKYWLRSNRYKLIIEDESNLYLVKRP